MTSMIEKDNDHSFDERVMDIFRTLRASKLYESVMIKNVEKNSVTFELEYINHAKTPKILEKILIETTI